MYYNVKGNHLFCFGSNEIDNNPIVYSHDSVIIFHDFPKENSIGGSILRGDHDFVEGVKKNHISTRQ